MNQQPKLRPIVSIIMVMIFLRLQSFRTNTSASFLVAALASSSPSSRSMASIQTPTSSTSVPRAAVSCVVRCCSPQDKSLYWYLLVQRGKEPNKGLWSLPGGKLEWGETILNGAKRELWEETRLCACCWHNEPIGIVDSIHKSTTASSTGNSSSSGIENNSTTTIVDFHYVISQCFAQLMGTPHPPTVIAADDAAKAEWHTMEQVKLRFEQQETTIGIVQVLERAERMYQTGMFPL